MSAIGLRLLFAALLASAAIAQTTVDNVCGETFMVGDLVFTLPSSGSVAPTLIYWNVADLATQYQLSLTNLTAFNSSDVIFDFANTTFSSWTWTWDCSLSCTNATGAPGSIFTSNNTFGGFANSTLGSFNSSNNNITTDAAEMCFFIFIGNNGQDANSSQALNMTLIGNAFVEQNGTGVLDFSIRLTGPLVTTLLEQANLLMLDFTYSCFTNGTQSNCSAATDINGLRADIAGANSHSIFTIVNHTVSLLGPNVAPCSLLAGVNQSPGTENLCGMNDFNLTVDGNVTVLSFGWNSTQALGFNTIFFDPRIYTYALNATGIVPPPSPSPNPQPPVIPAPIKPSFSRCFCNMSNEDVIGGMQNMSYLWSDYIMYTRLAVEEMIMNTTVLSNDTVKRLYNSTDALGKNFGAFYCQANGAQYAGILKSEVDAILANVSILINNNSVTNVTNSSALQFAQYWHAVNPFAGTDDVYGYTVQRYAALNSLMQALINQDGKTVVSQQNQYTQATRDMVTYLLQAFRFQKQLSCSKNDCGCVRDCSQQF